MSHYTVNSGVPKTLIQHLIRWVVESEQLGARDDEVNELLTEIVGQEITPELIPTRRARSRRRRRDPIGPYALHDFTLFHVLRYGVRPSKIAFLAEHAWSRRVGGSGRPTTPRTTGPEYDLADDPALARGVHQALLRQPVQAIGAAQRPQGQRGRHDVAAR